MKAAICIAISLSCVCLSALWLEYLNKEGAEAYLEIWASFSYTPPLVTRALFAALPYWWILCFFIAIATFAPLMIGKTKSYGVSILVSLASVILLVAIVYAPVLSGGSVI